MDLEIGSDPVPRPVPVVEPLLEEELPDATQSIVRKANCLVASFIMDMTSSQKRLKEKL